MSVASDVETFTKWLQRNNGQRAGGFALRQGGKQSGTKRRFWCVEDNREDE
jgi:hypothetical protein